MDKRNKIQAYKQREGQIIVADNETGIITTKKKKGDVVIPILIVLLALVSFSFLGESFAYIGSIMIVAIPGFVAAVVVNRAFNNFGMAAVSGMLVEVIMIYTGIVGSGMKNGYDLLLAISDIAGYLAALLLAVIIGIVYARKR